MLGLPNLGHMQGRGNWQNALPRMRAKIIFFTTQLKMILNIEREDSIK
jgi:hypothetical protein